MAHSPLRVPIIWRPVIGGCVHLIGTIDGVEGCPSRVTSVSLFLAAPISFGKGLGTLLFVYCGAHHFVSWCAIHPPLGLLECMLDGAGKMERYITTRT